MMKIFGGILPSGSELSKFSREHPIVTILGALAVYDASNTLIKALTSPKGKSPFASSYSLSGIAGVGIAAEGPEAWLKHEKASSIGYGSSGSTSSSDDTRFMVPLGHLTKAQKEELKKIQKELKAASKMHSGQADRLKQLGSVRKNPYKASFQNGKEKHFMYKSNVERYAKDNNTSVKKMEYFDFHDMPVDSGMFRKSDMPVPPMHQSGFGASTSTTTSTSASHAMMPKNAAPTLLETQGASSGMFGRMRATPPSLRRRIAQSVGLGNAPSSFNGKQEIGAKREEINLSGSVANLYAMDGFVPEMADDMMVM
tara:strand:- start:65 stop:1000 length:936 start_codon:yes stop_codon:yes gene_type:complete